MLIHARRNHVAGCPGEEQQHSMIGVVGKTVARIGSRQQLSGLGVVAGGDKFGDAFLFRLLKRRDPRLRKSAAPRRLYAMGRLSGPWYSQPKGPHIARRRKQKGFSACGTS